jgi:hypothetical protein
MTTLKRLLRKRNSDRRRLRIWSLGRTATSGMASLVLLGASLTLAPAAYASVLSCTAVGALVDFDIDSQVSAELSYSGTTQNMLRTRGEPASGPWERFKICELDDGNIAIQSTANGKWVSAEVSYTGDSYGMLRARASSIGLWEEFQLWHDSGSRWFNILSFANNELVTEELGNTGGYFGELRARTGTGLRGPWELFEFSDPLPDSWFATWQS